LIPLLLLLACPESPPGEEPFEYPLDEVLRFADLQALGTHNSYHLRTSEDTIPPWDYEHLPLQDQAANQGVRQFELDLHRPDGEGPIEVFHVPLADAASSCPLLTDCLLDLKSFSDAWPAHHPLLVLLEPKFTEDAETAEALNAELEETVLSVWPEDRLVVPSDVAGEADSLREGLEETGWPTLGALRGKVLFVLHTSGALREALTEANPRLDGTVLFPDAMGSTDRDYSAVHTMNDPIGSQEEIQAAVAAGQLVRTRADADLEEPRNGDTSRLEAALFSGAHFVSTDVPQAREDLDYVARIPGGTPSRCNPIHAPVECTVEAIEDPAFMQESRR